RGPDDSQFRPDQPQNGRGRRDDARVTGWKGAPSIPAVERERPVYAVANPGRIVSQPTFWPGPSKRLFGDAGDPEGDENRKAKSYGDAAMDSWPPAGIGCDGQDREDQGTERSKRFGWAGHQAEGAESQQMTMKVRGEPAKPLVPKMLVHPRSDRSVDQRYQNADRNGAHRGGSNDPEQGSKKVSPQGLPCLLRSTLRGDVLERS